MPENGDPPPGTDPIHRGASLRIVGLDALGLVAIGVLARVWFSERLAAVPMEWPLAGLGVCGLFWLVGMRATLRPALVGWLARCTRWRPNVETVVCLVLAVAYRLPAVISPWAWANTEAAYSGFPALAILAGTRPAPVFAEGAAYMGTLKGHLTAALACVSGSRDISFLMVLTSLGLYAVFLVATMSLARRISGRGAAAVAGLYLALSPRFVTVFSLNCLGQYVDLWALGALGLAVVARLLDEQTEGPGARGYYLLIGAALGVAFWQQPLALIYVVAAGLPLLLRAARRFDPWLLYALAGLTLGVLPLVVWNWEHAGATQTVVERTLVPLAALPRVSERFVSTTLPILAGLGRHMQLGRSPFARGVAAIGVLALVGAFAIRHRHGLRAAVTGRPTSALLPLLLFLANAGLVLSTIRGAQYERPRYLLPLVAALAVCLGSVLQWIALRRRSLAVGLLLPLLALNVAGSWPRLAGSGAQQRRYARIIAALDERGLRAGYADFSIAHPVTLFTAERIVLSPRLGPTPAWESPRHARYIAEHGLDVLVLRPQDDAAAFSDRLRTLGLSFHTASKPLPLFYGFSRPLTIGEVAGTGAAPEHGSYGQ